MKKPLSLKLPVEPGGQVALGGERKPSAAWRQWLSMIVTATLTWGALDLAYAFGRHVGFRRGVEGASTMIFDRLGDACLASPRDADACTAYLKLDAQWGGAGPKPRDQQVSHPIREDDNG